MGDPFDDVLRLVAEGRLGPEEAAAIIGALMAAEGVKGSSGPPDPREPLRPAASAVPPGPPRRLRVQVREEGRTVIDLQLPGLLAELAGAVPGIPSDYADRVRAALRAGVRGSIVEIADEDGSGVSISVD